MNKFYVYAVFRPDGTPCYIGKGCGGRWKTHIKRSANERLQRIAAKADGNIPIVILRSGLSELDAFKTEIAFIKAIGRDDMKAGPLVNVTDGGEGFSGGVFSSERKAAASRKQKEVWSNQALIDRHREITKRIFSDPELRSSRAAAARSAFKNDPTIGIRFSEAARRRSKVDGYFEKQSSSQTASWANEEIRRRRTEALIEARKAPDFSAKCSSGVMASYERNPRLRQLRSEQSKARWSDPICRAKMVAALKASWERRKSSSS